MGKGYMAEHPNFIYFFPLFFLISIFLVILFMYEFYSIWGNKIKLYSKRFGFFFGGRTLAALGKDKLHLCFV